MTATTATTEIIEIFSAIQGEGCVVGRRQIFVRFCRCDVVCDYCDTPLCHVDVPRARIEQTAGARDYELVSNPIDVDVVQSAIARLDEPRGRHHSISFTGGEPLLHPEAICALAPFGRSRGLLSYLETNGHLVSALRSVADVIDTCAMDIKIESTTGFPSRYPENREFLEVSKGAGHDVFCKIVVGQGTTDSELADALDVVSAVDRRITVVLQPVTPFRDHGVPPTPARLLEMQTRALDILPDVRVIPQTHKMLRQS